MQNWKHTPKKIFSNAGPEYEELEGSTSLSSTRHFMVSNEVVKGGAPKGSMTSSRTWDSCLSKPIHVSG